MKVSSLVLLLICFLLVLAPSAGATAPALYDLQGTTGGSFAASVAEQEIQVHAQQINGFTQQLELSLLDGTVRTATVSGVEARSATDITWRGWLNGSGTERVILTRQGSWVSGLILASGAVHTINPLPEGKSGVRHSLALIDSNLAPPCGLPNVSPTGSGEALHSSTLAPSYPPQAVLGGGTVGGGTVVEVDVMALYTLQARQGAGGNLQINVTVQNGIDIANTAFEDSLTAVRLRLVHAELTSRNDIDGLSDDHLDWMRNDPGVSALRDSVGADLVALISETVRDPNGVQICGWADTPSDPQGDASIAFQVTRRDCAVPVMALAHEHGHNLGFQHDPDHAADPASAVFPWAFGHFQEGSFRTVMALRFACPNDDCDRLALFSNPDVFPFPGQAAGIENQRDNARVAEAMGPVVAGYRSAGGGDPVGMLDAAECDILVGWSRDPDTTAPVMIEFEHEGVVVDTVLANEFRNDLPYGDKFHGFTLATPAVFRTGDPEEIRAFALDLDASNQATGSRRELNGSPATITCDPAAPHLVSTYKTFAGGQRERSISTTSSPTPFDFDYQETFGRFHERPGGDCLPNKNNSTYLQVSYGGPDIASCWVRGSWDSTAHTCSQDLIEQLNQGDVFTLNTDLYDTNPQDRCQQTSGIHLPYGVVGWMKLTLTTVQGDSVILRTRFRKSP